MDTKELTRGDYEAIAAVYMQGCCDAPLVFVLPGVPILWFAYEDCVADPEYYWSLDFYHHNRSIDDMIGFELWREDALEGSDIDEELPF